ncbi:Predicted nicotinamide N-methyase [Arboricoccus pini]|uniref:Predicted nicotinamide N-methyase n=1 Tax=Arboricoccus pini TaxID=1963835 RepID=A0A212RZI6_9PROT|nr:50S ribosomal protein L11 methyltransferase [Arboricoccus pini]SNB78188.1 Predicted nicotinamide N-methyase [Arboricoccus pini]
MALDHRRFVREHCSIGRPGSLPELLLYMAGDADRLWRMTSAERADQAVDLPFWAFPWIGGQGLGRWLLDNKAEVAGRRVLDLGAGSGLVAIAALLAGARAAIGADIDPFAIAAMELNAALNDVCLEARAGDLLALPPPSVDLVLVGDLFYEATMARRLLPWLQECHNRAIRVLVGDPQRPYLPSGQFRRISTLEIEAAAELEDRAIKSVGVFELHVTDAGKKAD